VLLVLVTGVLGWMWRRVTALPDWYEQAGAGQVDNGWVVIPDAEPPAGAPKGAPVHVVRNAHLRAPIGTPVEHAIKQSRITYAGGHMEAGAVINLEQADTSKLSAADRESFQQTLDAFPALTGRDVYVGVEGSVQQRGDRVVLEPGAQLRIGDTHYDLASAAERLGISEAELRKTIEDELSTHAGSLPD
jgi:hypothetical protein